MDTLFGLFLRVAACAEAARRFPSSLAAALYANELFRGFRCAAATDAHIETAQGLADVDALSGCVPEDAADLCSEVFDDQ